jgi:carbonic anhydrase
LTEINHENASSQVTANEALKWLIEGNRRYVAGQSAPTDLSSSRRSELRTHGQYPFAVVLTCSDSRVPPEHIFNQGLGDLFVVRVAGNVVDDVALGSIEYGVEHLGSPLLLVMGHDYCGAVKATVDGGEAPGSIAAIVERIKPTVDLVKQTGAAGNELYRKVEDQNILAVIRTIQASPIIKHLTEHKQLTIVGGKYHLDSGEVTFIEI